MSDLAPRKKRQLAAEYGRAVTRLRERVGLKQTELASRLGIAQSTLAGIETGRNQSILRPEQKARICQGLGVGLSELEHEMMAAQPDALTPPFDTPAAHIQLNDDELTLFQEVAGGNQIRVLLEGELTTDLLEALEQFLGRQKRRIASA